MSAFRVGQRVRIVACDDPRALHLVGTETRIAGEDAAIDSWILDCSPIYGKSVACDKCRASEFLAPITPSGHRPSELTFPELMDRCRAGEGVCA